MNNAEKMCIYVWILFIKNDVECLVEFDEL